MGLFTGLFTWPLAPVRGVVWVGEQLEEEAHRQTDDPAAIRRQLTEVERAREAGELTEEEAAHREEQLVGRLLPDVPGPGDGSPDVPGPGDGPEE